MLNWCFQKIWPAFVRLTDHVLPPIVPSRLYVWDLHAGKGGILIRTNNKISLTLVKTCLWLTECALSWILRVGRRSPQPPSLKEEKKHLHICTFALIGTYRVSNKFSAQHWRCHPEECEPKKRWYTGSAVSTLVSAIVSEIQRNPPGLLSALHQAECPWEDFFILIFSSRHWTLFIPCQSDKKCKGGTIPI